MHILSDDLVRRLTEFLASLTDMGCGEMFDTAEGINEEAAKLRDELPDFDHPIDFRATGEHSPGLWVARHRSGKTNPTEEETGNGFMGWEVDGPTPATGRGQYEKAADAYLIAASPEMKGALQRAERFIDEKLDSIDDESTGGARDLAEGHGVLSLIRAALTLTVKGKR